ncbi:uncharacterized protein LY79DRAFT_563802 [Colletotrichum navitas]|uniref:Uncharacterized protein n=1 Tax=Colletotrichum navitas TaxID=681940 RepID=A0AAD8PRY2_9PEZI|nr:uncharacterized protein LY79DRAFT_563802 [Colletotrichum navitas]KAK1579616.1 hypothetical protein LY79DRAFT_563802 [Colletotrichum navitas]
MVRSTLVRRGVAVGSGVGRRSMQAEFSGTFEPQSCRGCRGSQTCQRPCQRCPSHTL